MVLKLAQVVEYHKLCNVDGLMRALITLFSKGLGRYS